MATGFDISVWIIPIKFDSSPCFTFGVESGLVSSILQEGSVSACIA